MSYLNEKMWDALTNSNIDELIGCLQCGAFIRFRKPNQVIDMLKDVLTKATEDDGQTIIGLLIDGGMEWHSIEELCFDAGLLIAGPTKKFMLNNIRKNCGNTDTIIRTAPSIGTVILDAYLSNVEMLVDILDSLRPYVRDTKGSLGPEILTSMFDHCVESEIGDADRDVVTDIILKFLDDIGDLHKYAEDSIDYFLVKMRNLKENTQMESNAKSIIVRMGKILGEPCIIKKCLNVGNDVLDMSILSIYKEANIKEVSDKMGIQSRMSAYLELGECEDSVQSI